MNLLCSPESITVPNALWRYRDVVQCGLATIERRNAGGPGTAFHPGFRLPETSDRLERFFSPSRLTLGQLGDYRGRRLALLDLTGNPRTRTTKTFASLVIVARLVHHVQETGRAGMVLTPTSGNKGTALRDAVLCAIEQGLVDPDLLQITVVVPAAARAKLWSSPMDREPRLRARNPVAVYRGAERAGVKQLARAVADEYGPVLRERASVDLWYTLDLDNYIAGDVVRAAFEQEVFPPGGGGRLHVHAVSSAYGLLGHSFGRSLLGDTAGSGRSEPRYFLVQHLETPDMVLSLYFDSPSRDNLPPYRLDRGGLYRQNENPHFPCTTFAVDECIDPTFYTRQPPTSDAMNRLIRTNGGGGIVVSLHECLHRYSEVGALLQRAAVELPRDPRKLREWSLVMAMTGVLNAIDRGLVDDDDVLVHGSGSYADDDFEVIPESHLCSAGDVDSLGRIVSDSALTGVPS